MADQIIHTWKLNLVNWQLKMWKDFWVVQRCSYKVPLTSAGPFGIPLQPEQSHLIMRWNFIPTWGTTANDPRGEWGAQICQWCTNFQFWFIKPMKVEKNTLNIKSNSSVSNLLRHLAVTQDLHGWQCSVCKFKPILRFNKVHDWVETEATKSAHTVAAKQNTQISELYRSTRVQTLLPESRTAYPKSSWYQNQSKHWNHLPFH